MLVEDGKIEFPLKNRQFYLDVRNGKYTLEELEVMMETGFREFKELEEVGKEKLPKTADKEKVEKELTTLLLNRLCK